MCRIILWFRIFSRKGGYGNDGNYTGLVLLLHQIVWLLHQIRSMEHNLLLMCLCILPLYESSLKTVKVH